jgi:hypothetical protein
MAVYLCRWPNGGFSIVSAPNRADAIVLLDEWGNAEQAQLSRMDSCMFDFRLSDEGEIELAQVGECTHEIIMEKCYPVLDEALGAAEFDDQGQGYTEKGHEAIRQAVECERTRLWDNQPSPKEADTELGRQIQRQFDAPSVMVNRTVRRMATRILRSDAGSNKRPN